MGNTRNPGRSGAGRLVGGLCTVVLFLVLSGLYYLDGIPGLPFASILIRALVSGFLLAYAFWWKRTSSAGMKILLSATAVLMWQSLVIPSERLLAVSVLVLMYVYIGYLLWANSRRHPYDVVMMLVTCALMVYSMNAQGKVSYSENPESFRYWQLGLIAAPLFAAAMFLLLRRGILKLKDDRTSERVSMCILAAFVGFILPAMTLGVLNYGLDTSEPRAYSLPVLEKEVESSGRRGNDYILTVELRGEEIELEVSRAEYEQYEIGHELSIHLYRGALNDPYYIVE